MLCYKQTFSNFKKASFFIVTLIFVQFLVLDKRGMTSWYEWSGYCPEIINLRKTACRITELRRKGILFLMEDGGQDIFF